MLSEGLRNTHINSLGKRELAIAINAFILVKLNILMLYCFKCVPDYIKEFFLFRWEQLCQERNLRKFYTTNKRDKDNFVFKLQGLYSHLSNSIPTSLYKCDKHNSPFSNMHTDFSFYEITIVNGLRQLAQCE